MTVQWPVTGAHKRDNAYTIQTVQSTTVTQTIAQAIAVSNVHMTITSLEQLVTDVRNTAPNAMVLPRVQNVSAEDMGLYVRVYVEILVQTV